MQKRFNYKKADIICYTFRLVVL